MKKKKMSGPSKSVMEKVRKILNDDFRKKTTKNKRFSIRSYSRQVRINHSVLSRLMNGEREIGFSYIKKILSSGQISDLESAEVLNKALAEEYGTEEVQVSGRKLDLTYKNEKHMVMVYLGLKRPSLINPEKIASSLKLDKQVVETALSLLDDGGEIELLKDGGYRFRNKPGSRITLHTELLNVAERKANKKYEIDKAVRLLQSPEVINGPLERWMYRAYSVSTNNAGSIERLIQYLEDSHFEFLKKGLGKPQKKTAKKKAQLYTVGFFAVPEWTDDEGES